MARPKKMGSHLDSLAENGIRGTSENVLFVIKKRKE